MSVESLLLLHVLLNSLWPWSHGLTLTSVGLQGPCWDVKGLRWLLSPPPSLEQSISGRGYLPSMICFIKIRRPFQYSGSLLTCASPPSPLYYAPVISWWAHTKGSPTKTLILTMEDISLTRSVVHSDTRTTEEWGIVYMQCKVLWVNTNICGRIGN